MTTAKTLDVAEARLVNALRTKQKGEVTGEIIAVCLIRIMRSLETIERHADTLSSTVYETSLSVAVHER